MIWVDVGTLQDVEAEDAIRVDHLGRSYAVYVTDEGDVFCTDGLCTADGAHLAGGLVEGTLIECPDGGCLFDIRDGAPKGPPARAALAVYAARVVASRVEIQLPG